MLEKAENLESRKSSWFDYPAYFLLRLFLCLIQSVEPERADRFCQLLAKFTARWLRLRRKLVRENLNRVFPHFSAAQIDATEERMWLHLLRLVCEVAIAPRKIHRTNWYEFFRIRDRARMLNIAFDQRPKIIVTGHLGNFEIAGFVNGVFGLPSTTIARELDNKYIHNYVTKFRETGGQHFLSKNSGAAAVQALLDKGSMLALLADQEAGSRGVWVDFLGHPASCHKALALFTLSSGAPMIVCVNRRLNGIMKFELRAIDSVDPVHKDDPRMRSVEVFTRWYNACLEVGIRESPDQYWWVHRRWREPPPRLLKKARQAA